MVKKFSKNKLKKGNLMNCWVLIFLTVSKDFCVLVCAHLKVVCFGHRFLLEYQGIALELEKYLGALSYFQFFLVIL